MIVEGKHIKATDGMQLRRKADGWIAGSEITLGKCFNYIDGTIVTPYDEKQDDYEEVYAVWVGSQQVAVYEISTESELATDIVRSKYSAQEEIALLNKTIVDGISEEYKTYLEWRETAKEAAKMHFEREDNTLAKAKADKIKQLTAYDKSSAVNEFTLFGHPTWLELRKREDMRQSLVSLKAKGFEEFTYWLDTTPITLPIAQFEAILDTVEVYAIQCFNVTAQHKAAILALESVEDVEAYDFTTGYPEKVSI